MDERVLAPARHLPSPRRHADGPFRVMGLDLGPLSFVPSQPPGWSHLVTIRSGAATVRTASMHALVLPSVAAWVPSGTSFGLDVHGDCELRVAYVADGFSSGRPFGTFAFSGLLGELIERAMRAGYLDPMRAVDAHLLAVIDDELRSLRPANAFALPFPRSRALRAAVECALGPTGEATPAPALAAAAAMSLRTFERAFRAETGVSPRTWLRSARLNAAAIALATGASVTEAGVAAGYASLSAFIAAYRRDFGITPGRALRRG